ncbi:uncharacterized protein LOC131733175 isoform X3 [Acipenser ruthenus]|uniref:uncharacterized protein LOC131733175 isoform X3 n=1 Tax=Acipenser ruthenus TaxID=7906 RepID=UPI002740FA52|nr:uncharacterized protein LOC131733175 isoform X3 [Acipenser ruthenus]
MIYRTNMMSTQGVPLCSMPFLCCCARRSQDFKTCRVEDSDEPDVGDAPVAILAVVSDDAEKPVHFNPIKISIVLESEVMVTNLPRLADAFLTLMLRLRHSLPEDLGEDLSNRATLCQLANHMRPSSTCPPPPCRRSALPKADGMCRIFIDACRNLGVSEHILEDEGLTKVARMV